MKNYNRALDCLALAAAQMLKGRPTAAGALLVKASKMPDAVEAINIIEASNKEAYARAKVTAAAKKQTKVKAAEEEAEDDAIKGLTGLDDLDEEEDMEVESAMDADVGECEPGEELDEAITQEDSEIDAQVLAKVLAAMMKPKKPVSKAKK
jgi:hypothetical protein